MGARCECFIATEMCPPAIIVGEPTNVFFLVEVTGTCQDCSVRCVVAPAGIGATCELSAPGMPPTTGRLPVGPGLTPITATVTITSCPTGSAPVVVDVAVRCLNAAGEVTCSGSTNCRILSCAP